MSFMLSKILLVRCLILLLLLNLTGCTYMKHASIQADYAAMQREAPSQVTLKHMIEKETYFVAGLIVDPDSLFEGQHVSIAAFSNKFEKTELVDMMYQARVGTHFGLNLPEGDFLILVLFDRNENGFYDTNEVIGQRILRQSDMDPEVKVLGQFDLQLTAQLERQLPQPIPAPQPQNLEQSYYFPAGSIRSLDDPLFSRDMATLGMYHPAAFLESGPTMFYALEEEMGYKIPVVFVHGIGGTVTEFAPILERLDRSRYKPWFFYYPSGGDLDQLADMFYGIFVSGKVVQKNVYSPMIIVAHSMGGLIVRESLNLIKNGKISHTHIHFFSLASPMGGHPAAESGEKHGLIVLPSWKDLNPTSSFLKNLYRNPLPDSVTYNLLYAYKNEGLMKFGENSDGVVPISSQLRSEAQEECSMQKGFNATHVGILEDEDALDTLIESIHSIHTTIPEDHLHWLSKGGYTITRDENPNFQYSERDVYLIKNIGKYLLALAYEKVTAITKEQSNFVKAIKGEIKGKGYGEKAWLQFVEDHPEVLKDLEE